jgi:DNA-binding LacI/PurR family transcriptional regulator
MKDVAALASVSNMTVSNVVNGRAGTVGEETRRRVERAMAELGFHPNFGARALRAQHSRTLGFLLRDESEAFLGDPFTSLMIAGVGDVLRDYDRMLLIQTVRSDGEPERLLDPVLRSQIDGAFVYTSGAPELRRWYIDRLGEIGLPFVVFDEILDSSDTLSVRGAERDAASALTTHLLEQGHERIAFIAAREPWVVLEQRRLGHVDALHGAGIDPSSELYLREATDWQPEIGGQMTRELMRLDRPPTAIMGGSDALAVGALQALAELDIRVPEDVAVTGYDDANYAAWVRPALTTVHVPVYEMGRVAAELLLAEIEGRPLDARQIVLPLQLVVRDST